MSKKLRDPVYNATISEKNISLIMDNKFWDRDPEMSHLVNYWQIGKQVLEPH